MKKSNAFTMIELLIIVALIGILAATVTPAFVRLQARARQSEAKQNLSAIFVAYQNYFSDTNTYPGASTITIGTGTYNCLSVAGWQPKGMVRYNYNCMTVEAFSPPHNSSACVVAPANATLGDALGFTVSACGNVDNDATTDEWAMNNSKQLKNIMDDVQH